MKKLFVTMLSILACGAAYALPVGNPSEASLLRDGLIWEGYCGDPCDPCTNWCDAWSLRIGFYGDYVFNKHLEVDSDGPDIEDTEIFTNAGYIALNFFDRFDIFTSLGATNILIDANASVFTPLDGPRLVLETETHFSWSLGARATVWECGCTAIGIEGQYFSVQPDITRITTGSTLSVYTDDVLSVRYHEWQVGLGISHRINMLVPYAAVKWSRAHMDFVNEEEIIDSAIFLDNLNSKNHWGYAVGVSLVDSEKALVTVEGRWGDEKAIYVNGQVRF
jgi:major outer membrane protein